MKNYIRIKAKQCVFPLIFLTVAAIAIYALPLMMGASDFFDMYSTHASSLLIFLCGAALIVPVWAANYKMSSRSLDVYYSLPVSRRKILAVNFLAGFAVIIIAYTVAYLFGFFLSLWRFSNANHIHYLWFYFSLIIPAYIVYSTSFFMFTRANNIADGVIFILFCILAVPLLMSTISEICRLYMNISILGGADAPFYFFAPGILSANAFNELLIGKVFNQMDVEYYIIFSIVHAVISALATFYLFYSEKSVKAENCGQLSRSPFGYTVFVPFYAVTFSICSMMSYSVSSTLWMFAIIFVSAYALEAFGHRTLRIGLFRFLLLVGCILLCVLLYRLAIICAYGGG